MTLLDDITDTAVLPNGLTVDDARAEAARAYELDRTHVFHSWSAQAEINPMTITASQGSYVWDGDGNRLLDFSSQLVFTNIGHQHPKVVAAIEEQAAKLCTVAPQYANDARSEAARLIAERTPGESEQGLLHQRWRRRHRARRADGAAAHRPLQGADALPLLPRRHRHRDQPDRRPAALGQRLRQQRRRALLRAVPLPLALPRDDRGGGVRARARAPATR